MHCLYLYTAHCRPDANWPMAEGNNNRSGMRPTLTTVSQPPSKSRTNEIIAYGTCSLLQVRCAEWD